MFSLELEHANSNNGAQYFKVFGFFVQTKKQQCADWISTDKYKVENLLA
jgi:hypothetical protein